MSTRTVVEYGFGILIIRIETTSQHVMRVKIITVIFNELFGSC